jgi:multiple sugar transport system ATP-binding protein
MTDTIATRQSAGIRLDRVTKRYRGGVEAVRQVDLTVEPGEFMVLVGPSGCGKSTLLRMIAGLEDVTEGRVFIGDKEVTDELPQQRDIAMVFQSYALYPRMTVRRNIGFGLQMRRTAKLAREKRVSEVAHTLGLEHLLDRRPAALSGGQRQRVAMGRAIAREPQVFLMDEPLSNLDAKLRVSMRAQLSLLHQRFGVTTVYVTHDQVEAMTLGNRVAVLRDGVLQQCDTPSALFRNPVNLFVAAFIGSPSMNFVQATVAGGTVKFADVELPVPDGRAIGDRRVILGVRPTAFAPASGASASGASASGASASGASASGASASGAWPQLTVTPDVVEDLGDERFVVFEVDASPVDTDAVLAALDAQSADEGVLLADQVKRARFTIRLPGDAPVSLGEPLTVAIDPSRLYFFDPETGAALS